MLALTPLPGHVLVELRDEYEHVAVTEKKYDTHTSGIAISVNTNLKLERDEFFWEAITNKRVFWEEYKDGKTLERDGKKYAFIKVEDLTGYEKDGQK